MNLTTIKNVVMAAIFLPSLFMLLGSIAVVRTSYLEYLALDEDKHYADLLSQAGSIAASVLPQEARATIAYLADGSPHNTSAMHEARSAMDQARQDFYFAVSDAVIVDDRLEQLLESWNVSYKSIRDFRLAVDSGEATIKQIIAAYRPAALIQLEVVDFLGTRVTDRTLLHKSVEFFNILTAHQGGLVTNFLVRRSLTENGLDVADRDALATAQGLHRAGISQLRYHTDAPIIHDIMIFEQSETGKKIERFAQAVLANVLPLTGDTVGEWDKLQKARFDFWRTKIGEEIADIRKSGDDLASRARFHLMLVLGISMTLFVLVAIVIILAARGVNLVDRLTREREILIGELRSAAQTDLLTGLYNRRGFEQAAVTLLSQAVGLRWVSIVLFDLDHFKQVNDAYGHDAGDAVLREVALIARRHFRNFDLLVRHGGEEFLALLPDCTIEETVKIAEKVRIAIETAEIALPSGEKLKISASFGCAGREDKAGRHMLEPLIKRADLALYAAKHSGRNRVVADAFVPENQDRSRKRMA
ncbi:diguanylate cyclase [Rhizobium sp. LjRoot30]|uniref:GGDEF domain-containing protein n=1 Tax=Rhizobium sp. LjRoot30 TaxID=3342320 RepID=UPI003ECF86C3